MNPDVEQPENLLVDPIKPEPDIIFAGCVNRHVQVDIGVVKTFEIPVQSTTGIVSMILLEVNLVLIVGSMYLDGINSPVMGVGRHQGKPVSAVKRLAVLHRSKARRTVQVVTELGIEQLNGICATID